MTYDLAIIGAGPAGSTLARLLAKSGLSIALIDGENEEHKKPCGGLLAPDAQKALARFDLTLPKEALASPQIFSVRTIDATRRLIRYYPRHYLNVDRHAFDKWLLSMVTEPVRIFSGRVVSIEREDFGEQAFALGFKPFDGAETVIRSRILIGADGASSIVRRRFFGDKVRHYTAIQQWFEGKEANPFYSCIFDEKTSDSCSWSIFKDGYFIYGGCFAPQGSRAAFEEQKKGMAEHPGFDFGKPVKTEACLALSPRKPADLKTGKDRVFLIGEAAGFISASSFEGISSALISGSLLAESFTACGGKGALSDLVRLQRTYRKKTRGLRAKLCAKMIKRAVLYSPPLRNIIMKSGIRSLVPVTAS